jgi:hypothetical protein
MKKLLGVKAIGIVALLSSAVGISACAIGNGGVGDSVSDDAALRSDVTPEGTVLIAFDGTNNYFEQNGVIAQTFNNVQTTGGAPVAFSYKTNAQANGAEGKAAWAYKSYVRFDAQKRARAIYYNGAPEGPTNLNPALADSGARFAFDDAFGGGLTSPVCKAIRDTATKKVFFIGYSRGAVLAHAAAINVIDGVCGSAMGAKLTWVGLVDPVESGMSYPYSLTQDCTADALPYTVYDFGQRYGCLSLIRSRSTAQPVPVGVFMKNTQANVAASGTLLSTIPVNGAKVRTFDFAGNAVSVHIDMGRSGLVYDAIKADGSGRGGLRFTR